MPQPTALRSLRLAVARHEAGHAAFILAIGAGEFLTRVRLIQDRDGNRLTVRGVCTHRLKFPDTPKGRLFATALHLAGTTAARLLSPDQGNAHCAFTAAMDGGGRGDRERIAAVNPTPRERADAEEWVTRVVLQNRAAIEAIASALVDRGELSGDEVRAIFKRSDKCLALRC